jgi:hypothetical protein
MTLFRGYLGLCIFGKIFPKNNRAKFDERPRNAKGPVQKRFKMRRRRSYAVVLGGRRFWENFPKNAAG